MKAFLLILLVTACASFGADGDIVISTEDGLEVIKAADAAILQSHERWLDELYRQASAIKVGSTYADLKKHFHVDGGLQGGTIRFVHNHALRLKIDVTFEREFKFDNNDLSLKIKTVSRPYLDRVIID
jgi:hypothetical protein